MLAKALIAAMLTALPVATLAQPAPGSIEARLDRVEAQLAIQHVIADYAYYLDHRDYAGYASIFTPDGEWRNATVSRKGRDAIKAMAGMMGPEGAENKANYHLVSNPQVDVTGDTAIATSRYLFVTRAKDGTPQPSLAGIYRDEFVKLDGKWLIKRRTATDVMPTPEEWAKIMPERLGTK